MLSCPLISGPPCGHQGPLIEGPVAARGGPLIGGRHAQWGYLDLGSNFVLSRPLISEPSNFALGRPLIRGPPCGHHGPLIEGLVAARGRPLIGGRHA